MENGNFDFQYYNPQTKKWHLYRNGRVRKCVDEKIEGLQVRNKNQEEQELKNSENVETEKPAEKNIPENVEENSNKQPESSSSIWDW